MTDTSRLMTFNLTPIIAILVALAAGCLGLAAADQLASARPALPAQRPTVALRALRWLRVVWMPRTIRKRWATEKVERQLRLAGLPWHAEDFAAMRMLVAGAGISLAGGVLLGRDGDVIGWFLAGLVVVTALVAPPAWLSLRRDQRQREIDRSLPDFLDRLSLGLEAGLGFEVALRRSAERFPGRLGEEARRMVRQIDRGHSRSAALLEMGERNPSDDLRAFAAAVRQADRLGTSLAKSLRIQSGLLRDRRRRRAQEAGRRLPVLIVFPLVFFFLPALLIVYLAPPLLHLFLGR